MLLWLTDPERHKDGGQGDADLSKADLGWEPWHYECHQGASARPDSAGLGSTQMSGPDVALDGLLHGQERVVQRAKVGEHGRLYFGYQMLRVDGSWSAR